MKYIFDNDLHIHSEISCCSGDPEQTPERILNYAEKNGLKTVCLTNHFWDENVKSNLNDFYAKQDYAYICTDKPLPQSQGVRFLFGCEAELDSNYNLGVSKERIDLFDFIVIPTTHLHMIGFTVTEEQIKDVSSRADTWVKRFDAVLNMDLPFNKVGIAHLTCGLIAPKREDTLETLKLIPESEMKRLFTKAAKLRVGIELNFDDMKFKDEEADIILRPYKIAKECGCKFYCGSDAHNPDVFESAKKVFERAIDLLSLTEDDKFII